MLIFYVLFIFTNFYFKLSLSEYRVANNCFKDSNSSTLNLKEIVLGRCHDFFNTIHKNDCSLDANAYNCTLIWNTFAKIVIGKNPCELKIEDFNEFFKYTDHLISENQSLFWSGAYNPAHESKI
jgi:hypothetical protein